MKRFLSSLAPVLALAFAAPASAQLLNQTVNVSAIVTKACTIDSGAGNINLTTTLSDLGALTASNAGIVSVRCTRGTTVSVAAMTVSGRSVTCSTASCGTDTIPYELYVSSSSVGAGAWTGLAASQVLSTGPVPLGTSQNKGTALNISYQAQFTDGDYQTGTYDDAVIVTYTVAP